MFFTASLFKLKRSEGQKEMEKDDEFQTDDDDDMEVSEKEETLQKRKKVFSQYNIYFLSKGVMRLFVFF